MSSQATATADKNLEDYEESVHNYNNKSGSEFNKEAFNNSTNNCSGLGDSISLQCMAEDGSISSNSSSVYGGSNTVNAVHSSFSSSDSMLDDPPKLPNSYLETSFSNGFLSSNNNDLYQSPIKHQKSKSLETNQFGSSSINNQMNSLNLNQQQQVDYDPFNDYMGIDNNKYDNIFSKQLSNDNKGAAAKSFSFDQQQIIAQALAAVASSTNANCSSGITGSGSDNNGGQQQQQSKVSNRSLTDNIEMLNSKFMSHKNSIQQSNNNYDKYSDKQQMDSNSSSLSSLLATVAAHNAQNQGFQNDSHLGYNSANLPMNLKRQSYPLSASQHQNNHQIFGSASNNNNNNNNSNMSTVANQSGHNSRLNSTPNLYNSNNLGQLCNEQSNRASNNYNSVNQHSSEKPLSMSASSSSFNFNLNNDQHQINSPTNNSCYDDDEVFSSNQSFNTPAALQQSNSANRYTESSNNASNPNFDNQALAQLYRSFLSGNNTNSANNPSTNNSQLPNSRNNENTPSQNSTSNLSDLLSSYNANLAALSINPDLINSSTFLNSTNSMINQLKSLNNSANSNSATSQQQYGNNSNNYSQRQGSSANLEQITAAVLKQRQSMMQTGRSGSGGASHLSGNTSSNIAALTSATSNIASLLNLNNANNSQNNQQGFIDSSLKRRSMNSSTFNSTSNGNSSPGGSSAYGNNSSLFNPNVGPNASHLLQNSSLASSARLNSGTSSSAAASILGNNSSLHSLTSLQHQSNSGLNNPNQHNLLNSNQMNGNMNGNNNNSQLNNNQQHQSNLLNFNMSPSASSNHGILSALSLSSTSGNSLQNQLLSASGKPLRSERLPNHIVEEIVKQAKIRRRNGGKKEVCVFCRNNGEKEQIYTSHTLKDASNHVACPILRLYQCPICHASGDHAHTIKYCPYAEKDSNCIKLFKENGRMSAAAAFLMNSLAGGNNSPSLTPPATPPPQAHNSGHSLMHHANNNNNNGLDMQSPGNHQNSINAYLNNSLNFNLGATTFGKTNNNEICSNINKSFSNCPSSSSMLNSSTSSANTASANSALTSRDSNNSSLLSTNFSTNLNK